MKKLLFALLFLGLFCTCKKDNYANLCGGNDPIKNLPWLKAKTDTLQKSNYHYFIQRSSYQDKTLFRQSIICPNCNSIDLYFDCDGNQLKLTQEQYEYYHSDKVFPADAEIIWKN
jgi:hypothetical protein